MPTSKEIVLYDESSFDTFSPAEYLTEYYSSVSGENTELLKFFIEASRFIPIGVTMLEHGGGPTVYQLISYAFKVSTIEFADYLSRNIAELEKWDKCMPEAHDWTSFTKVALTLELGRAPTNDKITYRENLVRKKLAHFSHVNAFDKKDDTTRLKKYDFVSSNFVAESIACDRREWVKALKNITSYVSSGGLLSMTVIRNAEYWVSGGKKYPSYPVSHDTVIAELQKLGFKITLARQIDADIMDHQDSNYEGYDGMVFVLAQRS